MSVEFWLLHAWVPYAAMAMVPFGVLLHHWRAADAQPIIVAELGGRAQSWPVGARSQLGRGRIASLIAATAAVLSGPAAVVPSGPQSFEWYGYLLLLAIAILAIAVLLVRPAVAVAHAASGDKVTDLSTRSALTFGDRWWFVAWAIAFSALLGVVLTAGLLSSADDQGRYTAFTVRLNEETAGGTTIAGWFFGVPILAAGVILLAVSLLALSLQARSAHESGSGRPLDIWLRRRAARTVLTLGAGAILITVSWVLVSIGAASSVRMSALTTELGTLDIGTSIAAFGMPLRIAGGLTQGFGFALLLLPLFTRLAPITVREHPEARNENGTNARGAVAVPQEARR